MFSYEEKIEKNLFPLIKKIQNPQILELGVQSGISTKKFLEICNQNNGNLYSVDINDCSKVVEDPKWKFIKSRDDDFNFIKSKIPEKLDVIFIDTLHEAKHVEKIFYNYYNNLKNGGLIFVDDVSHLPYINNTRKTDFYCEINNRETFNTLLQIYYYNYNCFTLNFSFESSGLAIIKKKSNNNLKASAKLNSREHSFKNLIRKLWLKVKN
tara:strand:+ start:3760 stop:4389 length:630 start_codon:yes stop_codon:yes gene_type:complete